MSHAISVDLASACRTPHRDPDVNVLLMRRLHRLEIVHQSVLGSC